MEGPEARFGSSPTTTRTTHTPPTPLTPPATDTVSAYQQIFRQALNQSNKTAKLDLNLPPSSSPSPLRGPPATSPGNKTNDNDGITPNETNEIATAKMLNYCIRMLHAHGWGPPTVLRAMALQESGLERGMKATMYQAMRDRRKEMNARRVQDQIAVGAEMENVIEVKTGGGNGSSVEFSGVKSV